MCAYMCTYIYSHVSLCVYVCVIHTCIYIHVSLCVSMCVCPCVHVYTCMSVFVCMCVYVEVRGQHWLSSSLFADGISHLPGAQVLMKIKCPLASKLSILDFFSLDVSALVKYSISFLARSGNIHFLTFWKVLRRVGTTSSNIWSYLCFSLWDYFKWIIQIACFTLPDFLFHHETALEISALTRICSFHLSSLGCWHTYSCAEHFLNLGTQHLY